MKHFVFCALLALAALGLTTGCEWEDTKNNDAIFLNKSRVTVQVISLTTEWNGFSLAPNERRNLGEIRNVDYAFRPEDRVQLGSDSSERRIVFVDKIPEKPVEVPSGPVIENVVFNNRSDYVVTVTPSSSGWLGFTLNPGQRQKIGRIRDVYFTFTPTNTVQAVPATGERGITFINKIDGTVNVP